MTKKTIDQSKLKIGDKVHYQPDHYRDNEYENGLIKEIPNHTFEAVRVVYNCAGDWDNYQNYTSALTNLCDLKIGWKHDGEQNTTNVKEEDNKSS